MLILIIHLIIVKCNLNDANFHHHCNYCFFIAYLSSFDLTAAGQLSKCALDFPSFNIPLELFDITFKKITICWNPLKQRQSSKSDFLKCFNNSVIIRFQRMTIR